MEKTISYSLECTDFYHLYYFTGSKTINERAQWLHATLERSKASGLQLKKQNIFNAIELT